MHEKHHTSNADIKRDRHPSRRRSRSLSQTSSELENFEADMKLLEADPFLEKEETLKDCVRQDQLFRRLFHSSEIGSPSTTEQTLLLETVELVQNSTTDETQDMLYNYFAPFPETVNYCYYSKYSRWPFREGKDDVTMPSRKQIIYSLPRRIDTLSPVIQDDPTVNLSHSPTSRYGTFPSIIIKSTLSEDSFRQQ